MRYIGSCLAAALVGVAVLASTVGSAWAEGIASEAKSLGGLSDRQCIRKVDRVIREERDSPTFRRVVRAPFTRRVFYSDGSVDFACFPDHVVVIVYFVNAGERQAKQDLENFLRAF